ncbi:MAG: hypothetical protein CM15mV72_230 [uncultured marine virus]|nr:MAG: hypothetical protein CM15mV72_230 [uncultured marine virus]
MSGLDFSLPGTRAGLGQVAFGLGNLGPRIKASDFNAQVLEAQQSGDSDRVIQLAMQRARETNDPK